MASTFRVLNHEQFAADFPNEYESWEGVADDDDLPLDETKFRVDLDEGGEITAWVDGEEYAIYVPDLEEWMRLD